MPFPSCPSQLEQVTLYEGVFGGHFDLSLGCALPPLKGPTVDSDAVGAIGHCHKQDIETKSIVLKPVTHPTLSASKSVDAFTGTRRRPSVLTADVVPVIRLQRLTHGTCIHEYFR